MFKELAVAIITVSTGLNPNSDRAQKAMDQMVQDYATCHVYWGMEAERAFPNATLSTQMLGRQVNAAYEAERLIELTNLHPDTFTRRTKAAAGELQETLDNQGRNALHSIYYDFCLDLYNDPGGAFVKRLPKQPKH